jgi:hypothetical protein
MGAEVAEVKARLINFLLDLLGAPETIWLQQQNDRLCEALRKMEHECDKLLRKRERWKAEKAQIIASVIRHRRLHAEMQEERDRYKAVLPHTERCSSDACDLDCLHTKARTP